MTIGPDEKQYLAAQLASGREEVEQLRISEVRELSGGWETDIYRITVHYLEAGRRVREDLVLRLYAGGHGSVRAAREFQVLTRAGQAGLPVPRADLLVQSSSGLGSAFVVMEEVQGATLTRVLEQSAHQTEERLEAMVRLLVRVNRVSPSDVMEGLSAAPGVVAAGLADMQREVERHRLTGLDAVISWLEANDAPTDEKESFLHNDFHPGNIIVREGELVAVDWSFAERGDHRLDLAWTALLLADLLGGSCRSWLLDTYERISGRTVADFGYFEALKLGARLVTLAGWLDGSLEIPVKKITPDAIRGDYRIHVLNVYERWKAVTGVRIPLFDTL